MHIKRQVLVIFGYGKNKNEMCLVIRIAICFSAGYHYVKLSRYLLKNTLQKIYKHYIATSD